MRISDWSSDVCSSDLADDLVGPVRELFAADPVWLQGFLLYAVQNSASLTNLARIIIALPPDSAARTVDRQSMVLRGLVAAGEFSSARTFLQPVAPVRARELVREPSFVINGPYATFDWAYPAGVTLGASARRNTTGCLRYYANRDQGGIVRCPIMHLR